MAAARITVGESLSFNLGGALLFDRPLDAELVEAFRSFSSRYRALLPNHAPLTKAQKEQLPTRLMQLGKDLFALLQGDGKYMEKALDQTPTPFVLEIVCPGRSLTPEQLAVLHAPWELLADQDGHLAQDAMLGYSPVRRIRQPGEPLPPDDLRLGLAFMASSPRGVVELDYEAEETAIIQAVGAQEIDLYVDDTGNPDHLSHRLASLAPMQALHLSCHGHNEWENPAAPGTPPRPVLAMEDDEGNTLPVDPAGLLDHLQSRMPRLLFLSACLSAARPDGSPGKPVHALAAELVRGGVPAIVGWDGSVLDVAATAFARELYRLLAERTPLEKAMAVARRKLLARPDGAGSDWHMARLWLGATGGGPLVGGDRKRSLLPADHGHKGVLGDKKIPVASHEMFVGRRRQLQDCLRALRRGEHGAVLLHGMGRVGKSSLAARLANRLRDSLTLAVVFERYDAAGVLQALRGALGSCREALEIIDRRMPDVTQHPEGLENALRELFCYDGAPCKTGKPVLLVVDDLERILKPTGTDPDTPHQVADAAHADVLRALLKVFHPAQTASRLLFTSRFPFRLEGLERRIFVCRLPAFKPGEQWKLLIRQENAALEGAQPLGEEEYARRESLLERALAVSRGSPGLQDLIVGKVALNGSVPFEAAGTVLVQMEEWLAGGDAPEREDVRAFLENLAVDTLLELAEEAGRRFLGLAAVFQLPVPEQVLLALADNQGANLERLKGLGLFDPYEDVVAPAVTALKVNALAAGRLEEPAEEALRDALAPVLPLLLEAWGGEDRSQTPVPTDIELARLAILAGDARIAAVCGYDAVRAIRGGNNPAAAQFGMAALALCEAKDVAPPLMLLVETARAVRTGGDVQTARQLLDRGSALVEQAAPGTIDPRHEEALLHERSSNFYIVGEYVQAEAGFRKLIQLAEASGNDRTVAVANGQIADILQARGELDEALRIRREVQLPVFERLGDVRETAVTQGQIADILQARGQLDEALRIRREVELPVYERLGDVRETAITQGKIADILKARGELDEALRIRREVELPVYERLGDVHSSTVTQGKIADILQARGQLDEALRIRREVQLPVFERLGDVRSSAVTQGQIADILQARGQLDEALRIRREVQLPVFEQLGDVRSLAVTQGLIADILQARGQLDEALRIRREVQLPVYERLGDVHSSAITQGKIADILQDRGQLDEALRIRREVELPVYERLGDVRETAVTQGKIADILQARGQLDEALSTLKDRVLPSFESLQAVREIAVTQGKIADILQARGQLDEAREVRKAALETAKQLQEPEGIASCLWGLAQVDLAQKDFQAAVEKTAQAYAIYDKLGRLEGIAVVGVLFGQMLYSYGQREEGLAVLRRSAEGFRTLGLEQKAAQVDDLIKEVLAHQAANPA